MMVVERAIVRLAAIRPSLEFIRERGCPFTPCEMSLCGQPDGECECLCLPGLRKYRGAVVTGHSIAKPSGCGIESGWFKIVIPQIKVHRILRCSLLSPQLTR